jgi:hypothetical protein
VLLPEPLGRMIATGSPGYRQVDLAERVHLAQAGAVDIRYRAQFECADHCETSTG